MELVRSRFNTLLLQLKPLSIIDLYYYWSLDFIGPLIVTSYRAKYVLIMVEHFNYRTISINHLEVDDLTKQVV
uniref:Uncharacterized protein n=1 Tax=Physcomitrium patens TaxID=3218 RepID=A0A2K1I9R8_PHYPA|nr:hypothetical protein PHYPA_031212 [Physcomitrium patens]